MQENSKAYEKAGVSLEAGYEVVSRIKADVKRTQIKGAMSSLGAFGAMFDLSSLNLKEPILVSGTDGVGTKLLLAKQMNKHDTIGQDLVAMCVNDILVQGAKPLYFLDYIAFGKNEPKKIQGIVKGIADGCILGKCALLGGESAEMPGMYEDGHYDLAGFAVGAVEKAKLIDGQNLAKGDIMLGLSSSGVHSNGFSLVRKIIKDKNLDLSKKYEGLDLSLGEELLKPTKIYVDIVLKVLEHIEVCAMVHITGGGFYENIPRVLKKDLKAKIYKDKLKTLPIFDFLQKEGKLSFEEIFNIFNMGTGFILIIKPKDLEKTTSILKSQMQDFCQIGEIVEGQGIEFV